MLINKPNNILTLIVGIVASTTDRSRDKLSWLQNIILYHCRAYTEHAGNSVELHEVHAVDTYRRHSLSVLLIREQSTRFDCETGDDET